MSYIIFWAADRESRRQSVKELFLRAGAMTPEKAIEIKDVSEVQMDTLQRLIKERVVLTVDGKHYFDEAGEEDYTRRSRRHNWFVVMVLLLICAILFLILDNK
jgi:hypothetical protein